MGDAGVVLALYIGVCASAGLAQGATRASTPRGILRHAVRSFVSLAGGIGVLCLGIWLLLRVTQG